MENLTRPQQQVLDFISRCIDTLGAPPTLREISAHIGTRSTVMKNAPRRPIMVGLQRSGYIFTG
jgi:SOS-response transcriptional repressor LexA